MPKKGNIMRKLFFTVMLIAVAMVAQAQKGWDSEKPDKAFTFTPQIGLNISDVTDLDGSKSYTSVNAGVGVDYNIVKSFSLKSGLFYTVKGFKAGGVKASPEFLEIPIYASYRLNFAENSQLQINAGPYLDYGVGGKIKAGGVKEDFFGGDDGANRFQMGIGLGAGYTLSNIYLGLQYQFGLTKIVDDGDSKQNAFSINIGYSF